MPQNKTKVTKENLHLFKKNRMSAFSHRADAMAIYRMYEVGRKSVPNRT